MKEITEIDGYSVAKIYSITMLFVTLLTFPLSFLSEEPNYFLLLQPILAIVAGYFSASFYNFIAKKWGGIKINLRD